MPQDREGSCGRAPEDTRDALCAGLPAPRPLTPGAHLTWVFMLPCVAGQGPVTPRVCGGERQCQEICWALWPGRVKVALALAACPSFAPRPLRLPRSPFRGRPRRRPAACVSSADAGEGNEPAPCHAGLRARNAQTVQLCGEAPTPLRAAGRGPAASLPVLQGGSEPDFQQLRCLGLAEAQTRHPGSTFGRGNQQV